MVSASANGSVQGDRCEARAIAGALGTDPPITACKSIFGECWGASGTLQTAATLLALKANWVPPTAGLDHPDREFPSGLVVSGGRSIHGRKALVNSFNGPGTNASLVVEKAD
jgi:3-oxoacyl-(acyl-carrier-protein) synthase